MNQQAMRKVQQMYKEIEKLQKEIEGTEFEVTSGPVTIIMYGSKDLKSVVIDPEFQVEDPSDLEMLGDLVVAASRQAMEEITTYSNEKMGKYKALLGGMGGLF